MFPFLQLHGAESATNPTIEIRKGFLEFLDEQYEGELGSIPKRKGNSLSNAKLHQTAAMENESFDILSSSSCPAYK